MSKQKTRRISLAVLILAALIFSMFAFLSLPLQAADNTKTIQAENFSTSKGVNVISCSEGGKKVGFINNNDYLTFKNIDLTNVSSISFRASSSSSGGKIEIRENNTTGKLISTVNISSTSSWDKFKNFTANITSVSGKKTLCFVFKGNNGYLFDLNYFIITTNYNSSSSAASENSQSTQIKPDSSVVEDNTQTEISNNNPKVWIYSDGSDPKLKCNDTDDISTIGSYMLMSNEFNTLGIVMASTHRDTLKDADDQGVWANNFFGSAYKGDLEKLKKNVGGYQDDLHFMGSSIAKTGEHFSSNNSYKDLTKYKTVSLLVDELNKTDTVINVLIMGSCTEPAMLVKHLYSTNQTDLLKKVRFIAHWTNSSLHQGTVSNPNNVANYKDDSKACDYLKNLASQKKIEYYELGAIGQHGIVSGQPKGSSYYNQFKVSKIGKIFAEGKYVYDGVDHSDCATFYTLLGTYGVSLDDVNSDGSNPSSVEQNNENNFKNNSDEIHDELLRRAKLAAK